MVRPDWQHEDPDEGISERVREHHRETGSRHGFCRHGELPGECDKIDSPDNRPKYVYVASSWRCSMQPAILALLRAAGIDCYDFRSPEEAKGFHWSEVMPGYVAGSESAEVDEYLAALNHPRSIEGFQNDMEAMKRADAFVLVLPCGRSAHLELGWAIGKGKRTAIFLDPSPIDKTVTPELMYKMADLVTASTMDLLAFLGVED